MNDAPSEQSQTTVLAISSGWPMRPIGPSSICLTSGVTAKSRYIRVSIAPGATALTRICLMREAIKNEYVRLGEQVGEVVCDFPAIHLGDPNGRNQRVGKREHQLAEITNR